MAMGTRSRNRTAHNSMVVLERIASGSGISLPPLVGPALLRGETAALWTEAEAESRKKRRSTGGANLGTCRKSDAIHWRGVFHRKIVTRLLTIRTKTATFLASN